MGTLSRRHRVQFRRGISLPGNSDGTFVLGNVIYGNDDGIGLANWADNIQMLHNTIDGNDRGVAFGNHSGTVFQNNVVSNNVGNGLNAGDTFAVRDHNDFFANGGVWCSGCSALGTGSLTDDPLYVDAPGGDFRLRPSSTLINAGIDLGYDVNGGEPGNFNGGSPDMGAYEAP